VTGFVTHFPARQVTGLQGSVLTQFVQVHPGSGVLTQAPVVMLQESWVQGLLSLQLIGVEAHPALGSQVEVWHKSTGGQGVVMVFAHCLVAGLQARLWHLLEGCPVQMTAGLEIHCPAL
jgi:hypothetical protein